MLLEFDPNAQLELEEATSYYDGINRKLGNTFVDAVERTLNRIVQFPEAWTPMYESLGLNPNQFMILHFEPILPNPKAQFVTA